MYLLGSPQILAAVRRSLEAHVLPDTDGFARVQVVAALHALDEVIDRLHNGDPVEAGTDRLADALADTADATGPDEPELAEALRRVVEQHRGALAERPPAIAVEPRDRYRVLVEEVWALVAGRETAGAARVRQVLDEHSGLLLAGDLRWMCEDAIASLR